MTFNVLIILTASYATYIYAAIVAVIGVVVISARGYLADEEVLQSRRDETENSRIIANLPILL
jgi:hypothetical protein